MRAARAKVDLGEVEAHLVLAGVQRTAARGADHGVAPDLSLEESVVAGAVDRVAVGVGVGAADAAGTGVGLLAPRKVRADVGAAVHVDQEIGGSRRVADGEGHEHRGEDMDRRPARAAAA